MTRPPRAVCLAVSMLLPAFLGVPLAFGEEPLVIKLNARAAAVAPVEKAVPDKPGDQPAKPAKNAPDEKFLQSQRLQRDNARNQYAGLPDGGETTLAGLVQLTQDRGVLKLEASSSAVPQSQRFKVKGINAVWTVNRSMSTTNMVGPNGLVRTSVNSTTLTRIDLDVTNDTDVWSTYASSNGNYTSISGQSVAGRVMFSQNLTPRAANVGVNIQPISLSVSEWQAGPRLSQVFRGSAKNLQELRAKYPDEFRKHLIPLLAKLSDLKWMTPGATDVYGVFTEIPADPQAVGKIAALLPELDSDSFSVRENAAKQLLELGSPGVLAALRMDRSELSDEQKGQLGRLVSAHRRRDLTNPAEAIRNTAFLADCLEHDDIAVRKAAKAALEKALGQVVAFDVNATDGSLGSAADDVRKKIQSLSATTQPAEEAVAAPGGAIPIPVVQPRIQLR